MEVEGIIEKGTESKEWCVTIVPAPKKSEQVRVDLRKLNKAVKRERFVLPTTEEITGKLNGTAVFSTLDAAAGLWQIPLDNDRLMTGILYYSIRQVLCQTPTLWSFQRS